MSTAPVHGSVEGATAIALEAIKCAGTEDDSPAQESQQIRSTHLLRLQRRIATAMIAVPTLATLVALIWASMSGVTASDLYLLISMHMLTMLGITVGYHRLVAHKAFQCVPLVRFMLLSLGAMAVQGPPINWVSNHRLHHQFSDQCSDPHSPNAPNRGLEGFLHAHILWMTTAASANPARYARDLLNDSAVRKVSQWYWPIVTLGMIVPGIMGALVEANSMMGFVRGVLWGGLVRAFTVHHTTWCINSISHRFGTRCFHTNDRSTNVFWLILISAGEAWHNCHHAFPRSARFGLAWWQLDLGWMLIRALERMRLATAVQIPSLELQRRKRIAE